jgi:hypothetical protein
MYLSANGIVVACDRSCICVLFESLWPVIGHTGHNDSTTTQIHDRSQATTIPLGEKYMTVHRPQRFNKHTNTWPISGRSCIYLLMESLLPVIGHVFVYLLNRCGLWMVMYLSASGIVVACDRSCICGLVELHRPQRFNKHTNTWPISGYNDSTSTQIHDR